MNEKLTGREQPPATSPLRLNRTGCSGPMERKVRKGVSHLACRNRTAKWPGQRGAESRSLMRDRRCRLAAMSAAGLCPSPGPLGAHTAEDGSRMRCTFRQAHTCCERPYGSGSSNSPRWTVRCSEPTSFRPEDAKNILPQRAQRSQRGAERNCLGKSRSWNANPGNLR